MKSILYRIGDNIEYLLKEQKKDKEDLRKAISFSVRDMERLLEGRLLISPMEIEKIAKFLEVKPYDLITKDYEKGKRDNIIKFHQFKKDENKEHILDLMNDYVELKEAVSKEDYTKDV